MRNLITENEIENIALSYLHYLGFEYMHGADIAPDGEHPERQYSEVVLATRLRDAIYKLNPHPLPPSRHFFAKVDERENRRIRNNLYICRKSSL